MRFTSLVLVLVLISPVLADDKKPDDGPMKPVELKVLDRLIGTWKDEATIKVSDLTKKERQLTSTTNSSWSLNGWFVQTRNRYGEGLGEDLQLMTFDVEMKVFRRWHFDSDGNTSESSGKWDAKTATLTWTGDLGGGIAGISEWKFVDKDTLIWSRIVKDEKGKVYSTVEGKAVRQK